MDKGVGCIKQDRIYSTHEIPTCCVGCWGLPSEQLTPHQETQEESSSPCGLSILRKSKVVTFRKHLVGVWPPGAGTLGCGKCCTLLQKFPISESGGNKLTHGIFAQAETAPACLALIKSISLLRNRGKDPCYWLGTNGWDWLGHSSHTVC